MGHKQIVCNVMKRQKGLSLGVLCLQIITGVLPAIYVVVYADFIDGMLKVVAGHPFDAVIGQKVIAAAALTAFQYFCGAYQSYLNSELQLSIEASEKKCLMEKMFRLRFLDMEASATYELANHVKHGIPEKYYSYYTGLLGAGNLFLSVITMMSIIMKYSLSLGLLALLAFVPIFAISIKGGREDYSALSEYMEIVRRTESFENILAGEKSVFERATFPYFSWIMKKWNQSFDAGVKVYLAYKKSAYTRIKIMSVIIKLLLCGIIGVILYLTSDGRVSIGICVILMQQVISLSERVTWDLYMYLYRITSGLEYQKRYAEFYALREKEQGGEVLPDAEKIVFEDVSFRYSPEAPYILRHLNLTLERGKKYALVGENGAGKSTLMKLLLGFYQEYEGNIWVDGRELRTIREEKSFLSPVFQNFTRYQVSVRENVGMDQAENLTDVELTELMEAFDLALLDRLGEEGYDTSMGRLEGKNIDLSGGQWQKLAIMRALSRHTGWLILDEPTAALDPMAESALYELFLQAMQDKIGIIITHRLGAARLSDEVLVLSDGYIKERGSHDALMEKKGLYQEMFESQRRWYQHVEA
ncbi:ATP-binding cassette, subfamily B [Lachnospiraceae bacterium XBB1006]|nr:ATP-binding cassette, subfamily B [Lachnospiraceae bacterium XBB1006]